MFCLEQIENFARGSPPCGSHRGSWAGRFLRRVEYGSDELWRIFSHIVDINGYQLSESASEAARARIAAIYERKSDNFGNAREMRTLFEDVVQAQANRLAPQTDIAPEQLQVFESTDIG